MMSYQALRCFVLGMVCDDKSIYYINTSTCRVNKSTCCLNKLTCYVNKSICGNNKPMIN